MREYEVAAEKRKQVETQLQQYLDQLAERQAKGKGETKSGARKRESLQAEVERLKALESLNEDSTLRVEEIEKNHSAEIQKIKRALATAEQNIDAQKTKALEAAAAQRNQAIEAVEKRASSLGQIKAAFDPVVSGIKNGTLSANDFTASLGNIAQLTGPSGAVLTGLVAVVGAMKSFADE